MYNLVNKANLVHNFSSYFFFKCFGQIWAIIRVNNCIYATLDICYSVWMTVWFAECKPGSHPHIETNTKCSQNTVVSPDDGHIVARNMFRALIVKQKFCASSWLITEINILRCSTVSKTSKYEEKLYTNLTLFTRPHKDAGKQNKKK